MRRTHSSDRRRAAVLTVLLLAVFTLVPVTSSNAAVTFNVDVAAMMSGVTRAELETTVRDLSGEQQTIVGGSPVTITSRSSSSGTPIALAEQYVYEHLSSYGLDSVIYDPYPGGGPVDPSRNVIGQIDGTTTPGNIVIVSCHLDSMPHEDPNYGADDDASGCAVVLLLARLFADCEFADTIRFIAFGSEENAPGHTAWGSGWYADHVATAGENVIGMISLDAIAVSVDGTNSWMLTRTASKRPAGEAALVTLWQDVRTAYSITGMNIQESANGITGSDQASFWKFTPTVPAVWIGSCDMMFTTNPNWHTLNDRVSAFDWPYYLAVTKSIVGLAAHEAGIMYRPLQWDPNLGASRVLGRPVTCGPWSPTTCTDSGRSWTSGAPAVAASAFGPTHFLHAVWTTDAPTGDESNAVVDHTDSCSGSSYCSGVYYARSSNAGATYGASGTWDGGAASTAPIAVSAANVHSGRAAIATSGAYVHVAYVTTTSYGDAMCTNDPRVLWVRTNTNYGASNAWLAPVRLTGPGRLSTPVPIRGPCVWLEAPTTARTTRPRPSTPRPRPTTTRSRPDRPPAQVHPRLLGWRVTRRVPRSRQAAPWWEPPGSAAPQGR